MYFREVMLPMHEPLHLFCVVLVSVMGKWLMWLHSCRALIICFSVFCFSFSSCNMTLCIQSFSLFVYSYFTKTKKRVILCFPDNLTLQTCEMFQTAYLWASRHKPKVTVESGPIARISSSAVGKSSTKTRLQMIMFLKPSGG